MKLKCWGFFCHYGARNGKKIITRGQNLDSNPYYLPTELWHIVHRTVGMIILILKIHTNANEPATCIATHTC